MEEDTRKIYLKTWGCQMNEYDSELIRSILQENGFAFTESEEEADVILLNTCSVRDSAVRKIHGHVHALRHQRQGKPLKIGILGCIATDAKTDLLNDKNLPIDFIVGPDSYKNLPDIIAKAFESYEKPFDIDLSELETYGDIYPVREGGPNAWIAIMRGCNNFCSFCIVPYTRGRERSRSPESILKETERLASEGYKQVTLLGQNVNSYQFENTDFANLVNAISQVNGVERIRFMSPHPKDFPEDLIDVIANNPKVCKHIHLPLQSGNTRILKMMNRGYTKEDFLALADKIKTACPAITLTTDVIVGFPTETGKEFDDTVDVMTRVQFDSAFIFKYSQRQGTLAARKYPDNVPDTTKTERIVQLNTIQKDISLKRNERHIGQTLDVLIENDTYGEVHDKCQGKTDGNINIVFPKGNHHCNDLIKVKVIAATPHQLKGDAIN